MIIDEQKPAFMTFLSSKTDYLLLRRFCRRIQLALLWTDTIQYTVNWKDAKTNVKKNNQWRFYSNKKVGGQFGAKQKVVGGAKII